MAYVSFEYYYNTYRGTKVDATHFDYYERKAESFIRYITLTKSDSYTDTDNRLKDCCCALIDKNYDFDNDSAYQQNNIKSENVGEYSVTYENSNIPQLQNKEQYDIALQYLTMTGLLYRGV